MGLEFVFILVIGSGGMGLCFFDLVELVLGIICVFFEIVNFLGVVCELWVVVLEDIVVVVFESKLKEIKREFY